MEPPHTDEQKLCSSPHIFFYFFSSSVGPSHGNEKKKRWESARRFSWRKSGRGPFPLFNAYHSSLVRSMSFYYFLKSQVRFKVIKGEGRVYYRRFMMKQYHFGLFSLLYLSHLFFSCRGSIRWSYCSCLYALLLFSWPIFPLFLLTCAKELLLWFFFLRQIGIIVNLCVIPTSQRSNNI